MIVPESHHDFRRKAKLGKVPFYQASRRRRAHLDSGLAVHAGSCAEHQRATIAAPSVCRRAEWRSRRRRADEQKSPRFIAHRLSDRSTFRALLHGPEQIADLPVPVAESPGAVRIGHPERSHLVEYLAPNSVFNSLPRQRSSPHLRPDDRLVTIDRVLHHASLGVA